MRTVFSWCLMAAWLASTGCAGRLSAPAGYEHLAGRNLVQQPVRWFDDCVLFKSLACKYADAAWAEVVEKEPKKTYSCDYAKGFHEGFIDYLDAGGNGEPPVAPPFGYRLTCYESPEGRRAIEDWFTGFRHGAAVARLSGLRDNIIVPLSAPILVPSQSGSGGPESTPAPGNPAVPEAPPAPELGPPPVPVPEVPPRDEELLPRPRKVNPDDNLGNPRNPQRLDPLNQAPGSPETTAHPGGTTR